MLRYISSKKKKKEELYNTLSKFKRNVSYPPSTAHTTSIF